jgi:hypothetical protein
LPDLALSSGWSALHPKWHPNELQGCPISNNVGSARPLLPQFCVYDFHHTHYYYSPFMLSAIHSLWYPRAQLPRGRLMERSGESVVIGSGLYSVGRSVYQCWLSRPSAFHSSWRSHIPSLDSETCCHVHTSPHSLWLSKLCNTSLDRRPR